MKSIQVARARPFGLMLVVAVALAAVTLAQRPSPTDVQLGQLVSGEVGTRAGALSALLAQSGVEAQGRSSTRVRVINLLRARLEGAERIKAGLIAALEMLGTEDEARIRSGQTQAEGFSDYQMEAY